VENAERRGAERQQPRHQERDSVIPLVSL
jgi:hypothetical protein